MKKIRYAFEAVFLYILVGLFKLFPVNIASNLGGFLGYMIGSKLAASRKAVRNVKRALPEKSDEECHVIVNGMWKHLGRIVAEYPHLKTIGQSRTKIIDDGYLETLVRDNKNAIFFGAHFGQWELNAPAVHLQTNTAIDISYRAPNNSWVDDLLMNLRSMEGNIPAHAKSREGGRDMMHAVKNGRSLGILIDQKYNQGLNIPFFGLDAMTNPFFVQIAQKYKCDLVPIRNTRLDGTSFQLNVFKPIKLFEENGEAREVEDVIKDANSLLESWIMERPEQWLWLHRRWKD